MGRKLAILPKICTIFFLERFLTLLYIYYPRTAKKTWLWHTGKFVWCTSLSCNLCVWQGGCKSSKKMFFSCVAPAWLNQSHQQKRLYIHTFCVFGLINPVCELCLYQAFQNYYELPDSFQIVCPHQINALNSQPQVSFWVLTSVFASVPGFPQHGPHVLFWNFKKQTEFDQSRKQKQIVNSLERNKLEILLHLFLHFNVIIIPIKHHTIHTSSWSSQSIGGIKYKKSTLRNQSIIQKHFFFTNGSPKGEEE
jgi:hypothetical protein